MTAKKTANLGLLAALAFVFSYIEFLILVNLGVPGVKLGLANLVVIAALYLLGIREACLVSLIRIVLAGFTFGNMASLLYSLGGGLLALAAMTAARRLDKFSVTGVSVLGGVAHNLGQLLVAVLVVETASLIYYLPVLLLGGTVSGILIGVLGAMVLRRLGGRTAEPGKKKQKRIK